MASKYHLEESVKWRIIGRLEAGQSIMETATCLNISRQTVSKLWKQFQNDGSVVRRPGQGRKRMTTASEDRYLALTARRNRKATARQLSSELAAATGTVASRQTIYRRLNEKGLYARKPRVCVLLSSQKKRDRFNWCKEHQNWTEHQWSHVLFTDESRFSLTGDSKRVYIWRESGTRNDPSNIVERDRFGSGGVMVWGGIMIDGRTPLHVFSSGSVTGQIYRDEVLDPYVRLFRGAYGPDFLFMDDNARPHRANLVDEFLESEDIKRIPWPPNSPDLNPIENLWDYLGRAIARIHPPPRDVNALKTALLEEWRLIPQTVVNNVISSLKTRCDIFKALGHKVICGTIPPVGRRNLINELKENNIYLNGQSDGPIEILVGADVHGKLMTGSFRLLPSSLAAIETKLGWTVLGKNSISEISNNPTVLVTSMLNKETLVSDLWALDKLRILGPLGKKNKLELQEEARKHFLPTVKINEEGHFQVHLPWLSDHPSLSENFNLAIKELGATVKRLKADNLYKEYG
ncbi:Transposable element Tcb2 transposase, partial [Stegodyphus mimosarum]